MSSASNARAKPKVTVSIDMDALYSRSPFITDLSDFLKEKDAHSALVYWLNEYENTANIKTVDDIIFAIDRRISDIDHLINDQLNAIIHHDAFQRLESAWRGLWYLVVQADGVKNIKIKVLDASWREVVRDIDRALEFDQSQLFHKIYTEEYGMPGGEPYGVLIGDYEISHRVSKRHPYDDVATLKGLTEIAAASFSPFIAGASSELFGIDDFSELRLPLKLQEIFRQTEYINWRALRDLSDARFAGLTLPRILMRRPYRTKPGSYKGVFFFEQKDSDGSTPYLWGNAAYALGAILIREFASVGWFGHIRGVPRNQVGGGLLTNLPVDAFDTDSEDVAYKPTTDVIITDNIERDLADLGLIPLSQCYDTPFAAFYSNQSIQKPKIYDTAYATVNAKLVAMLQHVLCSSRVAHYIKVIIRDKIGSFTSSSECEQLLRRWLIKYTSGREDLDWEMQARYPLKKAGVSVKEHPDKPGHYLCNIHLVAHYQIDRMVSELELLTELVQSN